MPQFDHEDITLGYEQDGADFIVTADGREKSLAVITYTPDGWDISPNYDTIGYFEFHDWKHQSLQSAKYTVLAYAYELRATGN